MSSLAINSAAGDRDSRTIDLIGSEGFDRLRRAFVVVVGLGGVGSHAAVALARAGVGRLRLVDPDCLTASSLNRHAVAVPEDVGRPKAELLAEHLERIRPGLALEPLKLFADQENRFQVIDGDPDLVIDAIDAVGPKSGLLSGCIEQGLAVVSCMGASARTEPALIRIADISSSSVCPLARQVRRRLRRRGIDHGITVVFSVEPPLPPLPPDHNDQLLRRGRARNRQPSLSTLPGIFGYAVANEAILQLSGLRQAGQHEVSS